MAIKPWKIVEEKDISHSKWFPLFVHKVELGNGKVIDDYYVSKLGDIVMIIAITRDKEIAFVRQYKHGLREITIELPAGRVEKENPTYTAKKELEEETGIIADELISLGEIYLDSTKDSSITFGFLVKDAEIKGKQKLDETEDIEVILIPMKDIDNKIQSGEIKNAATVALLSIARMKFPELFKS